MRKAKVILSAIAVFAVVGGAFALKANRQSDKLYVGSGGVGAFPTTYITGYRLTPLNGVGINYTATTTLTLPLVATKITAGL